MYCKNCGAQLRENAHFCPVCGAQQPAAASEPAQPAYQEPVYQQPAQTAAQPKNTVALVGFILALVGLIAPIVSNLASLLPVVGTLFALAAAFSFPITVAGLVCSAVGLSNVKKKNAARKKFAKAGLIISIVAIVVNIVLSIINFVINMTLILPALLPYLVMLFPAIEDWLQQTATVMSAICL